MTRASCFDSYFWSGFVYKLSKKVLKFTEAEQFVFIFEQSLQLFVRFSTKPLQHKLLRNGGKFKSRKASHSNLTI